MSYFFLKLVPPRPTFFQDITEAERAVMQEHGLYWKDLTDQGTVVVYGPVFDPHGAYGIGVVEVETEADVQRLIAADPVRKANLGTCEFYPMRVGAIRK
jgi:uncharacterized protein YciI